MLPGTQPPPPPNDTDVFTVDQLATMSGVPVNIIRDGCRDKTLLHTIWGNAYQISWGNFRAWRDTYLIKKEVWRRR